MGNYNFLKYVATNLYITRKHRFIMSRRDDHTLFHYYRLMSSCIRRICWGYCNDDMLFLDLNSV
ncbi:hypothetical protein Hdeb2414_s0021g00571131 [Helianthus debilis subsp. tardiflorus]